jgi:hypothetical protein
MVEELVASAALVNQTTVSSAGASGDDNTRPYVSMEDIEKIYLTMLGATESRQEYVHFFTLGEISQLVTDAEDRARQTISLGAYKGYQDSQARVRRLEEQLDEMHRRGSLVRISDRGTPKYSIVPMVREMQRQVKLARERYQSQRADRVINDLLRRVPEEVERGNSRIAAMVLMPDDMAAVATTADTPPSSAADDGPLETYAGVARVVAQLCQRFGWEVLPPTVKSPTTSVMYILVPVRPTQINAHRAVIGVAAREEGGNDDDDTTTKSGEEEKKDNNN